MKYDYQRNRSTDDFGIKDELRFWLDKKGCPPDVVDDLSPNDRKQLYDLVCKGTQRSSENQRHRLFQKLNAACSRYVVVAARGEFSGIGPDPSNDELEAFFSPLSPSERLNYLQKF